MPDDKPVEYTTSDGDTTTTLYKDGTFLQHCSYMRSDACGMDGRDEKKTGTWSKTKKAGIYEIHVTFEYCDTGYHCYESVCDKKWLLDTKK